ncbi:MAG: SPFH/Band 7/PHB domain protein [Spirochaetes bacterium]|jgi:regulator of protease activity HflC (stomatin/prohibitin superfamily)|nr:SPFH/Band 7/PHB domain protein [Spirochaetota bacterium]
MTYYLIIALLVFGGILIIKGVRIVPQAENWIVERFGKYRITLQAGLNLINPFFSKVAKRVDIRERLIDMPSQPIITADNATVNVNGVVFFKIMDPYKSFYGIDHLEFGIQSLAQTSLRAIMGKMTLDESLSKRDKINNELLGILDDATDPWGAKITRVELQDIDPPTDIKDAMASQMKAERNKRAQILEAEGMKQSAIEKAEGLKRSAILKAEGGKEAAELESEARERLAQAEARALQMVAESLLSTKGDPMIYLLGQEYIKKMADLAASPNSKFVMLPSDLQQTLKGLFEKR